MFRSAFVDRIKTVRALPAYILTLLILGCGQDSSAPSLGNRLTIVNGDPAIIMDSGDATHTISNPIYDAAGKLTACEFDFKSNNTPEHYSGKIYQIRRNAAGKVISFEAVINQQSGSVAVDGDAVSEGASYGDASPPAPPGPANQGPTAK